MEYWHERRVTKRNDRVVVKLSNDDGSFKDSVIIPTDLWPLSGSYEVFSYKNTEQVRDSVILNIFNSVPYRYGHCYQNTENLVAALRQYGYDAKAYVGWLFTEEDVYPIHHCWCVLNGTSVLDLADDYTVMLSGSNGARIKAAESLEEARRLIASFAEAAKSVPNSSRCWPVGVPTSVFLYVGCECSPAEGRRIYSDLIRRYPGHECERNCDENGWNKMQKLLHQKGLM